MDGFHSTPDKAEVYKMKYWGLKEGKDKRQYKKEIIWVRKSNTHIIGILKKENGKKEIFEEVMTEIFPKLFKYIKLDSRSPLKSPTMTNIKKSTSRWITIKLLKTKAKRNITRSQRIRNRLWSKVQQWDLQQTSQWKQWKLEDNKPVLTG